MKTIADVLALGLPLFPMVDKRPAFKGWQDISGHTDLQALRGWWKQGYRTYGIYLRNTGLCVVDCDDEAALEWARLTLPETPWRTKTRRGEHWYYQVPQDFPLREGRLSTSLAVDLKWKSGITAPLSQRDGHLYAPEGDWGVPRRLLPTLPALDLFRSVESQWEAKKRPSDIPLCPLIADKARRYIATAERSIQGSNGSFYCKKAASYFVNALGLGEEDALDWMREWNLACALPEWGERELRHAVQTAYKEGPKNHLPVGYALMRGSLTGVRV